MDMYHIAEIDQHHVFYKLHIQPQLETQLQPIDLLGLCQQLEPHNLEHNERIVEKVQWMGYVHGTSSTKKNVIAG